VTVLVLAGAAVAATVAPSADSPPPVHFGFVPSSLPRSEPAPIRMAVAGKYRLEAVGAHFEALQALRFEADRHIALDLQGVPVCKGPGRDVRRDLDEMERLCGDAAIGHGDLTVEVAFAGERMLPATSKMTVYNRGRVRGRAELLAFAYLPAPITAALQIPIEIRRTDRGRIGWEARPSIPKIAGGSGWISEYSLRIGKRFLSATCVGGKLELHVVSNFTDGTSRNARLVHPCSVSKPDVRQQPVEPAR